MWQGGDSMAVGLYRAMVLNNKPNRSSLQVDSKDHRVRSNHKQKLVLRPGLEFDMWTELWGSAPNSSKKKKIVFYCLRMISKWLIILMYEDGDLRGGNCYCTRLSHSRAYAQLIPSTYLDSALPF